jgi:hypothetical protein
MGFMFPTYVYIMEKIKHLNKLRKYEIGVFEMFMIYVLEILDPLSLNVKLYHCKLLFLVYQL